MAQSLRHDLVPRSLAQWMALLGLVPFAIGAWIQATRQRELNFATMAVEQRLAELERRLGEVTSRAGSVGVQVAVTGDTLPGSDSLRAGATTQRSTAAGVAYDSLGDGLRGMRAETGMLRREFDRLTVLHEELRARRGALKGVTAPANILLAVGALVTMAGVLTDIRQFRQQRRRAA
jgi:hypothetical protein